LFYIAGAAIAVIGGAFLLQYLSSK